MVCSPSNPLGGSIVPVKLLLVFFFGLCRIGYGQENPDSNRVFIVPYTIIEGDTIPWSSLDEVLIISEPTASDVIARKRYLRLRRKVLKVYPYAVEAGNKLDSLNLRLDQISSKKKRRKATKTYQKYLEEKFEPELRKLTRSEGQILCKLIHRETGIPVYDLIKEYRNSWTAFLWNSTAYWYDISLKQPYLPNEDEEDKLIEAILQRSFEKGLIKERVPFYPPKGKL